MIKKQQKRYKLTQIYTLFARFINKVYTNGLVLQWYFEARTISS